MSKCGPCKHVTRMQCSNFMVHTCVNRSPAINTGIQRGFSETTESGRLKHEVEVYALPLSEEALSVPSVYTCVKMKLNGTVANYVAI